MAARRKVPDLELSVEQVTPALAVEWLENNEHNRRLSKRLVSTYAEAMRHGEWRLNGEPIIWDNKGRLQSGQHRLYAVVESGVPINTVVVRNAEPDAIFSLDSGRKRTLGDALAMRGELDVNNLATAVTWVWRIQNDLMDRPGETATTTHLLNVLRKTPEIRDSLTDARRMRRALGFSVGLCAALHWAFNQLDPEDTEVFVERIVEGTNLPARDPALALRRWAASAKMGTRKPSQVSVAAITVKAWNAFREHRDVHALSFKGSEAFPIII
jgi:hypothetical protein